jgi:mono/diheme cytochrome c family protein
MLQWCQIHLKNKKDKVFIIMKKIAAISLLVLGVCFAIVSCDSKREPGKIYMPDMAYSRAYETYADRDSSAFTNHIDEVGGSKIYYDNNPVKGTIKRGELFPYTLPNDSNGYAMSAMVKNPYDSIKMSEADLKEAGRLYNINCAICHGEKAQGNGPISTSGKIGGIANLTLDNYVKMADGTMFHSIAYGKNSMGSYASQLDKKQRWMIIKYIRTLQPKPMEASSTVSKDSTKTK